MTVQYLVGDSRAVTATLPDGSVDLIASSPPFLALRSYLPAGHELKGDEIGSEANPAAFLDTLLELTAEWGRVLAPHGSIAIELGDTYSGSGETGWHRDGNGDKRIHSIGGIDSGVTRNTPGWPRAKSLALIPQLYAVALAYGINPLTGQPSPAGRWRVRNIIVWHRPNPAVGALGDKVRPSTSYIVVATRSAKRWFDLTAVRTPAQDIRPRNTNGPKSDAADTEVQSKWAERVGQNSAGAPPLDCWTDEYDGSQETAAADAASHDTWTLTTQPSSLAHYAMWPAKLAERLILMMCPREVCTVCGEPRRRVEKAERTIAYAPKSSNGARINGGEFGQEGHTSRATTGWTDCGCKCLTCEGRGLIMLGGGVGICITCSDGRAFRPGLTLDPFAGTGTTLAVADLHQRDAIGIDLDPRNADLYPARFDECKRALYGTPAPMPGQMELAL